MVARGERITIPRLGGPEDAQWKVYGCKDYAQYKKRFSVVCEELGIKNDGQRTESIRDADMVDLYMWAVSTYKPMRH